MRIRTAIRSRSAAVALFAAVAVFSALPAGCSADRPPQRGLASRERGAWVRGGTENHPLLREGAEVAVWWLTGDVEPTPQVRVIRAEGREFEVTQPADVVPFLRRIDTAADAVEYGWLLRRFEIDQRTVPGFGREFLRHDFDERLRAAGIEPEPSAVVTPDGYDVVRAAVVDGQRVGVQDGLGRYVLVHVHERIGSDGSYAASVEPVPEFEGSAFELLRLRR